MSLTYIETSKLFLPKPNPWLDQSKAADLKALTASIMKHGINNVVQVKPCDGLPHGEGYIVTDGVARVTAARRAGMAKVPCLVHQSNDAELAKAKIMESVKMIPTDRSLGVAHHKCKHCGGTTGNPSKLCGNCKSLTPTQRGLVHCLQPKCGTWIKKPEPSGSTTFGPRYKSTAWFCKKHGSLSKTLDQMPMHDRVGDPLWVTASFCVIKVRDMEESHLTNSINFMVTAAKTRASVVTTEADWPKYAAPRYQFLVAEAKRRAAPKPCVVCVDGIVGKRSDDLQEVICVHCTKGKERAEARAAAMMLLDQSRRNQTKLTLATASVFLVTFIVGGLYKNYNGFFQLVLYYLQQAGIQ